jgi:hypothetical protein
MLVLLLARVPAPPIELCKKPIRVNPLAFSHCGEKSSSIAKREGAYKTSFNTFAD